MNSWFWRCLAAVVLLFAVVSCGPDVSVQASSEKVEQTDSLSPVQSSLMSPEAAQAAVKLLKTAGRAGETKSGLIREAIDYSSLGIRYYLVDPVAAAFNAGQTTGEDSGSAQTAAGGEPLEILDYGPRGDIPMENRQPTIFVMFSQPMVPLARLGEVIRESDLLTLEPPVPGTWRWNGTKTLSFRPDKPLLEHPRYTVTVSGEARSLSKNTLGENFSFDLFGERLKMVNIFPGNNADEAVNLYRVPPGLAREITVEFNQPVNPETVSRFIRVRSGGKHFGFTVSRPDYPERLESRTPRGILLRLDREPPESSGINIVLKEGAFPFEGYPPSRREEKLRMYTMEGFKAERLSASSSGFALDNRKRLFPVYLSFSAPLAENLPLDGFGVLVDGKLVVPGSVEANWSSVTFLLPDIEPGMNVSVKVPPGVRDVYGRTAPESILEKRIPRPAPAVNFQDVNEGLYHLEAEFPPSLLWITRNVTEGSLGLAGKKNYYDNPHFRPAREELDFSSIPRDTTFFHQTDLSPYLEDGKGTVFLDYSIRKDPAQISDASRQWADGSAAVQVTNLGLTVRAGFNRVLVWVNRLSDGTPAVGADVTVFGLKGKTYTEKTDSQGLAVIELPAGHFRKHLTKGFQSAYSSYRSLALKVRAELDGDLSEMAVEENHNTYSFDVWNTIPPYSAEDIRHRIHMFTDRGLYKGGEELALRGIHWLQDAEGFSAYRGSYDIQILGYENDEVIWEDSGRVSSSGGFSHRLTLPDEMEPGTYRILYEGEGFEGSADFRVGAFRRLNFQVTSAALRSDYIHGETVDVAVQAGNLAGGGLPFAPYHYYWTRKPVRFVPPGTQWTGWSFGPSGWFSEEMLSSGDGSLSGSGEGRISEGTFDRKVTGSAYRYTLETTVEDVDRQVISSTASAMVHPASCYVAARFDQGAVDGWWSRFVAAGDTVKAAVRLVDFQGNQLEDDAVLEAGLIKGEWQSASRQGLYGRVSTQWEFIEKEVWTKQVKMGRSGGTMEFSADEPGQYTLFFVYTDKEDRPARTEIDFYVTGSGWVRQAGQTPQDINMVPDKELYKRGDTARLLVQSPIPKGRYLLTVERERILEQKIVELDGSSTLIEIPVREEYLPVVYVALSSFTERTRTEDDYFKPDFGRPRSLFGIATLRVSTAPVELDVSARAVQESYTPGEDAEVLITVKRDGKPVEGAEVTVLAVDRGVLDLLDYHVPNPLEYFYDEYNFPLGTLGDDSRRMLLRPVTYEVESLQGGDAMKLSERRDFNPLAFFEPAALTGRDGSLKLKMKLPDTLTRYRLTAVALKDNRLGMDEGEFTVSNPVNVRTALPRSFRNRDSAAAGLVLTNTTEDTQDVTVRAESDILSVSGQSEKTVSVPGKTAVELPFLFEARRKGEGTVRFEIRSAVLNEVLVEEVVVEQPVVTEAFTTVGAVPQGDAAEETVVVPEFSAEGYGSLSLSVNSSFRPYIEDALSRLNNIVYRSRNESLYALAVWAIAGEGRGSERVTVREAERLLRELTAFQFSDGGIGYRSPSERMARPNWFLSALTAQAVQVLKEEGLEFVNPLDMGQLYAYLLSEMDKARRNDAPSFLAVWSARVLAGEDMVPFESLKWLVAAEDRLGLAGYYLLSEACSALGKRNVSSTLYQRGKNFMTMGTQSITLKETYEKSWYFSCGEAELALFLDAAASRGEHSELLMRIATSLDQNRNARRFRSSFDDFWVVMGFRKLLNSTGKHSGPAMAVTLEDQVLLKQGAGRKPVALQESFPFASGFLSEFPWGRPLRLVVQNGKRREDGSQAGESSQERSQEGQNQKGANQKDQGSSGPAGQSDLSGRTLYYSAILRYALPAETAQGRDEGVEVFSRIETLDGEVVDFQNLPLGETLRMRVNLSTPVRRSFLKLIVPVPSGAEIVDTSFATTSRYEDAGGADGESYTRETVYGDTAEFVADGYASYGRGGWSFWFYRPIKKIYDNAVSYMWEDFYAGSREITFLIRTTTPGIYPTPPVAASLEFEPEVFGRESGRLCVIRAD